MKIVFPDQIDLQSNIIEEFKKLGEFTFYQDVPKETTEIINRIKDAEIITANWIDITKEIIEAAPKLKYIIVPSIGYDWIDVKTATERNIKVINCPTHNTSAVANLTIGLIINITRQISQANNDLKSGKWQPSAYKGTEIEGKKLGLIGYGNIGKKVGILAEKLGMEVHALQSTASDEEIDNFIASSDIVSLHLPLTEKNRYLIDDRRLKLFKKTAFLINTARGAIVDQQALIQTLKENKIAGAALDVYENEPLNGEPSEEIIALANMRNVLATPHIAFNSEQTWERLGSELLENIRAIISGNPIHAVN